MLRMTQQRTIILDELKKLKTHPTADELFLQVRKRLPRISLATVYRNLELMAKEGLILKLEYSGKQKRFDGDISPHHHISCTKCGKVVDVSRHNVSGFDSLSANVDGFKLLGHRIEFLGICKQCQK